MVIKAQLLAIKESEYTVYVFKDLEKDGYIMCTRLPNWQTPVVTIGASGFLEYETVKAGELYYQPGTNVQIEYKYSNVYFNNFIPNNEITQNNEIIL